MFVNRSGHNEQSLNRTFHRCCLPSFGSFRQAVSEEKIFKNQPIRNKNCLWRPCLLMDRDKMANLYRGPSIDASYQISVHLVKWFQRRRLFRNQPIRNNKMNCELMLTYDTLALRQTGSRNLTGQQKLPMIWGTFMKLVTK